MQHIVGRVCILLGAAALWVSTAAATTIDVGYISWDVNFPGNSGQFDITNLTGPNSAPSQFPITTSVALVASSLSLTVHFSNGSTVVEPASYFSLDPVDGLSYNGTAIPIAGTNPEPTSATLTGLFSPTTISVTGMGTVNIQNSFTVTFSDTPNLVDGDLGVIAATTAVATGGVPEPGTWMLLSIGMFSLMIARVMKTRRVRVC